jgi:chaperonin cofactor prefoldin
MESKLKESLAVLEKKLEALEEKIDIISDEISEIKEYIPTTLEEDLSEIKSMILQMS